MKRDLNLNITETERREVQLEKIAFMLYNNECITRAVKKDMENRIYAKKELGISSDEYDNLVRGYMLEGEIVLYKSSFDILEKGKGLQYDYDGDPDNFIFPGEWSLTNKELILLVVEKYEKIFNTNWWKMYILEQGIKKELYSSAELSIKNLKHNWEVIK